MPHSKLPLTKGWSLKQHDDASDEWLPVASVPSEVHVDLLANKKIPDPFVDLNEQAVHWVGEKAWIYKVSFATPTPSSTSGEASSTSAGSGAVTTDLVFEGLDTFATVSLNGREILKADNMFAEYRVNVSDLLKPAAAAGGEENLLEIVFASAMIRGRQLVEEHKHEHSFYVRQTENSRIPVRKAQYHWGWDWGPLLNSAGPWKPVYLEQYVARVDDVWAQSEVSEDLKTVSGTIYAKVAGSTGDNDAVIMTLAKDGKTVFEKETTLGQDGIAQTLFTLENPELWYPFGYGSQSRYELKARLVRRSGGGDKQQQQELSSQSKLTGFRRTQLVQEPDQTGKCFFFRINNIDIFCGGSCWIPGDSFLTTISDERYRDWILLMVESNQIMLRVWGGGVYESDAFLDACDELGVLLWHDFQFACANYPVYESFLTNFELEARQQIRRLRTHPAMVIWAGNNEDYMVQERYQLEYDFENKDPEAMLKSTFPARYIYEYWLPKVLGEEDPHMIYHPSSPWGDGKPWADETVGDMHQWHIWHGNMNRYQEVDVLGGRFISEFGMEAYPHLSTLKNVITDSSQHYPGSIAMDAHNKAAGHQRRLGIYLAENFRTGPPVGAVVTPGSELAFFTHLTQILQAETMRYAYKFWRRTWRHGHRHCGGVLVWQLNDCWPTVSWAVVDYHLVRKPGFYAITRALRPIDVGVARTVHDWTQTGEFVDPMSKLKTGQVDHTRPARKGTFDVWIASSKVEAVEAEVTVRFISVSSGKDVHASIIQTITASANTSTDVLAGQPLPPPYPNAEDLATTPFSVAKYDPYVIHATVSIGGQVIAVDTAWPEPLKYLDFPDRGITFEVSPAGDKLTIAATKPVKGFVVEEMVGLKLSDNGFDLVPGEKQEIKVEGCLKAGELRYTYIGAPSPSMGIK